MVKQLKKLNKSRKNKKSCVMRGGDERTTGMAGAYFTNNLSGYYQSGSKALEPTGKQSAVSRGTISSDSKWAGPNLYPMKGGNCGCNKRLKRKTMKNSKRKNKSNSKSKRKTDCKYNKN